MSRAGGETLEARVARTVAVLGERAARDVPLGARTTYRVGGTGAAGFEIAGETDVGLVQRALEAGGLPVLVLGRGSNMLVADEGFPGLVVWLGGGFAELTVAGTLVRAGGGVSLPVLARRTVAAGLHGLEWAVGVPGSVGGAVRMNAGGHGSDTAASLRSVRLVDLAGGGGGAAAVEVDAADLGLGYRSSALGETALVLDAMFALEPGDPATGEATLAEIVRWRREHQPGGQNAGSVFTNPPGDAAGRLIEAAGCKGLRVGSAEVSPKHANFIQADEGGRAADVYALVRLVQARVAKVTGVRLRTELRLVGFASHDPDRPAEEDRR